MGPNVQDAAARAKQLISERKYQDAVRACRRALLSRPHEASMRVLLAQALLALGRHDEVRVEMQALLKKVPEVGAAHRLLGEALLRGGKKQQAIAALKEALRLDPEDDEARDLLDESGDVVEEIAPLETIERWFPDEPTRVETADDAPATQATAPALASVELAPDFEAEVTRTNELEAPARKQRGTKSTLLGLPPVLPPSALPPAPRSSAGAVSAPLPPAPSVPPPPPGGGVPSARPPRVPKRTMVGGFAPPPSEQRPSADAPAPTHPFAAPFVAPPASPAAPPPVAGFEPLSDIPSMSDFESADSASVELSDSSILLDATSTSLEDGRAFETSDDDDGLGAIEPLAGEPTRARPPVLDGVSDEADLFEAGLQPAAWETPADLEGEQTQARASADFDDETTRGQGAHGLGAQSKPSATDYELTAPRPQVADFPSDEVDTGLPPLDGEATLAKPTLADPLEAPTHQRPVAGPVVPPSGFSPSASPMAGAQPPSPIGGPASANAAHPAAVAQPAAKTGDPTAPVSAVTAPTRAGRVVRIGRWTLPLPVAIALAGVPVLIIVMVVAGVRWYLASQAEEAIAVAAEAASRDGMPASLRHALELDAEQDSRAELAVARRARLYAMAVHDHGFEEADRAQALLGSLGEAAQSTPDALVARTYLALERAQFDDADQTAILLDGSSLGGEAGHARAVVALTRGELERAEVEARAVAERLPGAPRYVALHAQVLAAVGRAPDALERLAAIPNGERSPVVALARAGAQLAADAPEAALDALTSFESELVGAASARQRAHAARLRLVALVALGRSDEARAQLETVLPLRPANDEAFALDLVRAQVALGDLDGAQALVAALPVAVARRERRASVLAEVHLAAGDLAGVEAALRDMGESPRASYLHGRLAEAQGQLDAAKRHYRAAADHATQRVPATARLASIAFREGREANVIELLEPLMPEARADAEVVSTLAQAYLANDRADDAERVVAVALAERPDSTDLLLAKAEVDLARGEAGAALTALEALLPRIETSPRAHATLGEAARREGRNTRAEAAFTRALELDPRQRLALLGRTHLALDDGDPERAEAALAAARDAGAVDRATEIILEGRLLVMQGFGNRAATTLRRGIRRNTRDAELLLAFGLALLQAEDDRNARSYLDRVLALDPSRIEAVLGVALIQTRRGDLSGAAQSIDRAEELISSRELGAMYEARALAARARLAFENGSFDDARQKAEAAIAKDSRCAQAHFVMAMIADARGTSPIAALRAALAGRTPYPEVRGLLVVYDERADDRCDLARHYAQAAPRGVDAREVRRVVGRCR